MNPITHFLVGWALANVAPHLERRDRALVALAGISPDVDGLGIVPEVLTKGSEHPLLWFSEYHHVIAHNVGGALVATGLAAAVAWRPSGARPAASVAARTAALALVSFHLHLLCDLAGARGPEGNSWPIPYLLPFSDAWQLEWSGQWALNAWPNFALTGALLLATFFWAWRRGYSPIELVSTRADAAFVATLRARLGAPRDGNKSAGGEPARGESAGNEAAHGSG